MDIPPDEHHHESHGEQQDRGRPVIEEDQKTNTPNASQDVPEHLFIREPIPLAQDKRRITDSGYLGYFRGLETDSENFQPTRFPIYHDTNKGRNGQQNHRDRQKQTQQGIEPARYVVHQQYKHETSQQESRMTYNRSPMIRILISNRTGCTEDLDHRDQTQEHEDHPYHPVALEQFTC